MLELFIRFLVLSSIIVLAGAALTRFADYLADHTGMGRSLAGLILLAAATSLPELSVNCRAALLPEGGPDLALGDTLGSSLYNILILAVLDLGRRSRGRMLSPVAAAHSLSATASLVLTALVALFLVIRSPLAIGGVGVGTILIAVGYLLFLRLIFFDHQYAAQQAREDHVGEDEPEKMPNLAVCVTGYLLSTCVVFVAAIFLVPLADEIADRSGLGRTFIGTSLVALSTSLPEIVTTLAAVRMGSLELAVGNIFGSNAFNVVVLLPVDMFYRSGSLLCNCKQVHVVTALAVIIATSLAMSGMLYRPKKRYWFIEPDAALVAVIVITSLGLVYALEQGTLSLNH